MSQPPNGILTSSRPSDQHLETDHATCDICRKGCIHAMHAMQSKDCPFLHYAKMNT